MKHLLTILAFLIAYSNSAQEQDLAFVQTHFSTDTATSYFVHPSSVIVQNKFAGLDLLSLLTNGKATKNVLGYSRKGKPIEAYYFPGTGTKKALVIGGVHGSELSGVEVAKELIGQLQTGERPFYSVIIVPSLFPDNARRAEDCKANRVQKNAGRYTAENAIDPNRQMPPPGQPFYLDKAIDAYGREIETENTLLLQLIQVFAPDRIVNLHAIRDASHAGVYADPRTDCQGRALGFFSDSTLAILMATYIHKNGGSVPGNKISSLPTSLYYLDPKAAPEGELQARNLTGMNLLEKIAGVSLGTWASTAVCNDANNYKRPAMRIITMEFPGYKKPSEYIEAKERERFSKEVTLYAGSICRYFLQAYCTEETGLDEKTLVQR